MWRNLIYSLPWLSSLAMCATLVWAADTKVSSADDPDYKIQGEYSGTMKSPEEGQEIKLGVQIVALGSGKFHAVAYRGGLPGDGWNGTDKQEADGEIKDGVAVFPSDHVRGEICTNEIRRSC